MKAVKCPYCGGSMTKRTAGPHRGPRDGGAPPAALRPPCATTTRPPASRSSSRGSSPRTPRPRCRAPAGLSGAGPEFWEVWPMPVPDGELHRVLFVDGIWLARELVVLICCSGERVVSWYMAESENSRAWSALMAPIPAPDVVVTDGGSGFAKAVRATWPRTKVQRCIFHAFSQVKSYTTTRPKLQAGRELYLIALDLMHIETLYQAELWASATSTGAASGPTSSRTPPRRREEGLHPREAQEGEDVAVLAGLGGDALHLPRSRAPRPARSLRPTIG